MPPKSYERPSIGRRVKNRGRNHLSKTVPAASTSQNLITQESPSNTTDDISCMGLFSGNNAASTHATVLGAIGPDHSVGSDMTIYVHPGSPPLSNIIPGNATLSSEVSTSTPTASSSRADQIPGKFLSNVSPPTAGRTGTDHTATSDMDPSRLTRPSAPMGPAADADHDRIRDAATSTSNSISFFNGSTNTQIINSTVVVQQNQITPTKTRRSDTVIRQEIPLKPEVFHGRDGLCDEIAQLLTKEETSRVCILGPGGMGKTSVSLAVVELPLVEERFPPGNCVWVPCIEATSATLLLEILYLQLQLPGDEQVTLGRIISELDASKQPRLILLDNFETPWNAPGGTKKQVEDILRQLAKLNHIAILLTMRETYAPCNNAIEWQSRNIQPTDEEACLRIFHQINPSSKDDPDVGCLLTALGHMPFAVTLMANLGREGKSTAKELLDAWFESGPDLLSDNPEESMNRSITLSVESDLVKRNSNATILLAILSLLPAGTTRENLRWWAPALTTSKILSAIATLSKAALLVENKREISDSPVLFVVPVVQSFMQQHHRIEEELRKQIQLSCCQFVLAHTRYFSNPTLNIKKKELAAEDTNIQSILFGLPTSQHTVPSDKTMEALIAFSWYRCDTTPNLEIANYAVTVAKASQVKRYIAWAIWCLGMTYYHIGDLPPSYNHLQEAYQLYNSLPPGEVASQQLGLRCGIDLVDVTRIVLEDTGEAVSLARDVERKCATLSDDLIHGRSLVCLGTALDEAQQWQEALVHLDRARAMLKAVGNTPNLTSACQVIARVHYHERRLTEALDAIQEAWKHTEESSASPNDQAGISLEFGGILFSANRDAEAWEYIEIALMKASHVGDRLSIAHALQYMGYGYLRRGDYQNAYGAYEAAAEKYLGTIYADDVRCKGNMARIKQKQGNPDSVVGFYRHSFDVDRSLFYPPIQVSANDVPISGS